MSIFLMLLRKMLNNYWIVGCLLLGLIISVALVSSIPSYTSAVLQNVLNRELQEYQIEHDQFPGHLYQFIPFRNSVHFPMAELDEMDAYFHVELPGYVQLPVLANVTILSTINLPVRYADQERYEQSNLSRNYNVQSLSNVEEHIELSGGRMPEYDPVNEVYEVLVSEAAMFNLGAVLETEFVLTLPAGLLEEELESALEEQRQGENDSEGMLGEEHEAIILEEKLAEELIELTLKPVGIFKEKEAQDLYWFDSFNALNRSFIMEEFVLKKILQEYPQAFANVKYNTAYDYGQVQTQDISRLLMLENRLLQKKNEIMGPSEGYRSQLLMHSTLNDFLQVERRMTTFLWSLNVPILIMLALYLLMVSRLIVDRQKADIAVLRSRGSSRFYILLVYFMEVCLLGLVALFIGPFVGLGFSKILGASNGFLEFVQRTALPVQLSRATYAYAFYTIIVCLIMVMIPVFTSTRYSIVSHQRSSTNRLKSPLWQRTFLDVILLALSWYGWSIYQRRQQQIIALQVEADTLIIDPLLFFVPAIFIIGLGLLCLRIYPWLISLVNWLGKKYWSPALYATFIQVGRSSRSYQFLMLFLIMTIAVGIFNAGSARTINANMEEQIRYEAGADITLQVRWESSEPRSSSAARVGDPGARANSAVGSEEQQEQELSEEELVILEAESIVQYTEPPFIPIQTLPGVEQATKVFIDKIEIEGNGASISSVNMMAVEPDQFGQTAWFKPQLLDYHWYDYLNLLAEEPSAVLISDSVAEHLGVQPGDYVDISLGRSHSATFVVFGVISYWPSWNPYEGETDSFDSTLVVANLRYVQNRLGLAPYEVWLRMDEESTSQDLYDAVLEREIPVQYIRDARQEIISLNNSAFLLGLNGALTMGFLIALCISFFGFLLYWVLTLKGRILQYGIFRAMGLSFRQLISVLTTEQLLTSGVACIMGVMIGGVTTRIFVPLFGMSFDAREVPPFQVIFETVDEVRLYAFVSFMMIVGLVTLGWLLSRIRIHQAVKLGDD